MRQAFVPGISAFVGSCWMLFSSSHACFLHHKKTGKRAKRGGDIRQRLLGPGLKPGTAASRTIVSAHSRA
ncbi:hypothetical protein ILYODFUR_018960 [Ilyodon furcidens]|uniref:Secreted protein n=1 Tax=Ilyodon furcidens TaxID=33524 RepID=A0ABV0SP64_9TELE